MVRNRRAGVEDRWTKTIREPNGATKTVPSANHGKGSRWRARYVDEHGREHAKGFAKKIDAQRWIDGQVSDQVTGTWTDPTLAVVTFGTLAERWYSTKATRAPKTVAGYRSLLDTVVLPRWRDMPLRDVRFEDIQVWISGLSVNGSSRFEGRGLSASRVRQTHQLVGAVLKFAVKAKHLPANPAEGVELPRVGEVEQRFLTHEQLHRLAVAAGRFRTLVFVLGYCGLRFGEAAALRVGDVNLADRRIRVRRSVTHVTGRGLVEGPTKNHSARTVPVPTFLVDLLATEVASRDHAELVFPSHRGGHVTVGEVRWIFDPAAEAIGQAGLTPHDLRHTCASLSIAAGCNVKVLQRLLGHKTATMTLDRYGHLFADDLDAIADAFDAAADGLRTVTALRTVAADRNMA